MKKVIAIAVAVVFVLVLGVPAVFAGNNGQAGKSNTAHLYMYQKYLAPDGKWNVYPGGAWGKMTYFMSGTEFSFVMNGHGLAPSMEYTLIYYPDPWPGHGLMGLGSGTTDASGDVTIEAVVDTGDLPAPYDMNAYPATTTYKNIDGSTGAKIWLVLSSDVDCGARMMTGWTIDSEGLVPYLFESKLVMFDDTDYNVATWNLWQKNPADWSIVVGGSSGILTYNLAGPTFDFAFDAQKLTPGTGYTLIYFPDPYPGTGLIPLGTCTADANGHVSIAGMKDIGSLPAPYDANAAAKMWLVLSGDVGTDHMTGWNPDSYLFEEDPGIVYTDTGP